MLFHMALTYQTHTNPLHDPCQSIVKSPEVPIVPGKTTELITKAQRASIPSHCSEDNLGSIALGIVKPPGQLTVHIFGKKKIPSVNFFFFAV